MEIGHLTRYLSYHVYNAVLLLPKISAKSDIELLHQFRVSIRRCRALLKLYVPEYYALQAVLRSVVQHTNTLRELDVFVYSVDSETYPELSRILKQHRNEQYLALLTDTFVTQTSISLLMLYDSLMELNPEIDATHLIERAEEHYQKSLDGYISITKHTSEEVLHELRIHFKITRYALEFLQQSSLHNEQKKIKECKKIQEHLGKVQDAANQLELLKSFCEAYPLDECHRLLKARKRELKNLKKATIANQ